MQTEISRAGHAPELGRRRARGTCDACGTLGDSRIRRYTAPYLLAFVGQRQGKFDVPVNIQLVRDALLPIKAAITL